MAYIKGKKVLLTFLKDGTYLPFLCATDCSINIVTATKSIRTIRDGIWARPAGQSKSFSVSLNGLIELQETSPVAFWLIENYDMQMLPVDFQMIFMDATTGINKYITGKALIVSSTLNGVAQGFATSSFDMTGYGALIISNTPNACEASIGYLAITDSEAGQITLTYDFVIDAVRFDYTIDGGERESIFDPGNSGTVVITGIPDGTHTIVVYPICENGNDGYPNELTFEMTGGGAEVCNPPEDVTVVEQYGTSALIGWTIPTPAPAGGFEYEVFLASDLVTPVDSGTSGGDGTTLNGLTEGADYYFRVRSICVPGESLSSWSSVSFSVAGGACNAPASVSPDIIGEDTATMEWTAASPVPPAGYGWELLLSGTPIDSGTTSSTSVNLTDLTPGTTYGFRVRSLCAGGATSTWATTTFDTAGSPPADNIDWSFAPGPFSGAFEIKKNAVVVVSVSAVGSGTFSATGGDSIEMTINALAQTGTIEAYNNTAASMELSMSGTGVQSGSFSVADGNTYSLTGTIS